MMRYSSSFGPSNGIKMGGPKESVNVDRLCAPFQVEVLSWINMPRVFCPHAPAEAVTKSGRLSPFTSRNCTLNSKPSSGLGGGSGASEHKSPDCFVTSSVESKGQTPFTQAAVDPFQNAPSMRLLFAVPPGAMPKTSFRPSLLRSAGVDANELVNAVSK